MGVGEDSELRLNVYLQERGVASRRKADELIAAGHVSVNGRVVTSMGFRVPKGARVAVDGKVLSRTLGIVTYLFYKPDLCLTSRHDPQNRRTIFDLPEVQKLPANVQPVGRLDFRSEGLLLLTNDGDLAFALTHPRFSVEKKYAVLLSDLVAPDELEKLRRGVMLDDGLARAVSVRAGSKENMGAGKRGQWVEVVVTEGRNRLIRRMLEHLGHKVNRLVRVAIGDVQLPAGMKPGSILAVQGKDLTVLNRVRDDFLKSRKETEKPVLGRRAPTRRRGMSDELYAEERVRRSLESSRREAERLEKQREEKSESRSAKTPKPQTSKSQAPKGKVERTAKKPTHKTAGEHPAKRRTVRPS
jgi:23S rRNA pseudouridine2605 synthase